MTQAAIYCRISKDREADGLGVERQRADCAALAERLGWTVAATFVDDDRSAYSGKRRPAYQDLLSAIDAGTIGAVVAWHPDRLHRSPKELETFIDLVELHGTAVQTVTAGAYDLTTPTGRMQARIVGNVARFESEHKSERLRRKVDDLVAAGQPHTFGGRPFGWRRVGMGKPPRFGLVPTEAAEIREAVTRLLDGASVRSIVRDWRARDIRTTGGLYWQPGPMARMLGSAHLAGLRERHVDRDPKKRAARNGEVAISRMDPDLWPGLITEAEHRRLRAILTDPRRRTTPGNARVNLLAGFLVCGRCGARMIGRPRPDGVRRYVCPQKALGGCNGVAILAEPTEAEVVGRFLLALDNPTIRDALAEPVTSPTDPLGERAEAEARMAELAGAYAAGEITRPEWQTARDILVERLAALAPAPVPAVRLPADVRGAWPGLDLETRRRILATVVEHVTIGAAVRGRNAFNPNRVEVAWCV